MLGGFGQFSLISAFNQYMPVLLVICTVALDQKRSCDVLQILCNLCLHLEAMNYLVNLSPPKRLHVSCLYSRALSYDGINGSSQQQLPSSASLS